MTATGCERCSLCPALSLPKRSPSQPPSSRCNPTTSLLYPVPQGEYALPGCACIPRLARSFRWKNYPSVSHSESFLPYSYYMFWLRFYQHTHSKPFSPFRVLLCYSGHYITRTVISNLTIENNEPVCYSYIRIIMRGQSVRLRWLAMPLLFLPLHAPPPRLLQHVVLHNDKRGVPPPRLPRPLSFIFHQRVKDEPKDSQ